MEASGGSMKKTLSAFAGLLLTLNAMLQPALAQQHAPAVTPTEVVALRAQLDIVRDYQDRFVGIVMWSLGAVVTMTIGLLAFGWYTNKTNYERDRDAVRQERETLRHELRAFLSDEIRRVTQEVNGSIAENEKAIQQRVEKTALASIQKLSSKLDSTTARILEIEHDNLEREAKEALKEKNPRWAVYKYCELLDSSVRRQADHYEVPDILDSIKSALATPGIKMYADDVTNTVEALNRLPAKYQAASERLVEIVKSLQ